MATTKSLPFTRPAKDEWGVYDPQQAGLAALFARLDARDKIAAAAAKKDLPDPDPAPAPAAPVFRGE